MERQHTSSHEKDAGKGRQVCGQVEGLVQVVNHELVQHASPVTNHLHSKLSMLSDPGSSTATTQAHSQGKTRRDPTDEEDMGPGAASCASHWQKVP